MSLEIPTEEWKKQRADFHLDPDKQDPVDPRAEAELKSILDQISIADFETLDGIFDRLSEAVLEDKDVVKDYGYLQKLEAAHKRGKELMETKH